HARIDMLSVITLRPAIEPAILHQRQVVWNEIWPKLVPHIHYGPQRVTLRLPTHAVRIAHTAGKHALRPRRALNLPARGAIKLCAQAIFHHVAVGAYTHIKLRPVLAGNEALRPVMVYGSTRQRRQHSPGRGNRGVSGVVWETQDCVGIGDVE